VGHTTDEVRRTEHGATYLPERNQTAMHEKYSALIAEHNVFWGVWLDNMFDYASRQSTHGMRESGMVCYDHTSKKDSYYLYRALWNSSEPTLYVAERKWQRRADKVQSVKVYSSVGRPELIVADQSVELQEVMPCVWSADSVVLDDVTTLQVVDASNKHHDSVKIIVDKLRVRR
jgi:beta-galactosidase